MCVIGCAIQTAINSDNVAKKQRITVVKYKLVTRSFKNYVDFRRLQIAKVNQGDQRLT